MNRKLFVDTMVFLHFRPLEELDLRSRTQSETVTIVVPQITLRELDKHKSTHSSRRVRDRARRILAELETAITTNQAIKGGIAVEYFPTHPKTQLDELHLDSGWGDDVLIASVIAYKQEMREANVAVLSQDTGPRLLCHHHGITTFVLDDSVALQDELDETERENRTLRQRLQRLEHAMPRLEVAFVGAKGSRNVAKFTLAPHPKIDEEKITNALGMLQEAYPKKRELSSSLTGTPFDHTINNLMEAMSAFNMHVITPEQIHSYNRQLDEYYDDFERFLREQHELHEPQSRTISFTIEVCNTGTAPADDVDIHFHFPDGFRLFTEGELPDDPDPPTPPDEPISKAEALTRSFEIPRSMLAHPSFSADPQTFTSFRIRKTNSYNVSDHFRRIKHGIPALLPMMYIEFPSLSEAKSFTCTFELRPANLSDPVTGVLHFVVDVIAG